MTTSYRLATEADLRQAYELMREEGQEPSSLEIPTIVAIEDEKVVGVLGTTIQDDKIIAGPLILKKGKTRHWTIVRLIDIYDITMRSLGIKSYIHSVHEGNEKWLEYIKKVYGIEPYAHQDGYFFFVKRLDEHGRP